jgi:hypothetical protein
LAYNFIFLRARQSGIFAGLRRRARDCLHGRGFLARRMVQHDGNEKARCNQAAAHDNASVHFRPSS